MNPSCHFLRTLPSAMQRAVHGLACVRRGRCGAYLAIGLLLAATAGARPASAAQQTPAARAATPVTTPSNGANGGARRGDAAPAVIPPGDSIGPIEGEAIAITGPMSVEVVHGQVKTVLRSGSDVRVKSGTARIDLVEGGVITICGPAHLSILKAGGAVTVALESGTIHAHLGQSPILTVYTPQIKAQPIPIGDAALDLLAGFDTPGAMCIRAGKGAVRLEQQLSGQSIVIPQMGDVLLSNGQLDSLQTSTGRCVCEVAPMNAPGEPETGTTSGASGTGTEAQPQVSQLATSEDLRKRTFDAKPNLPAPQPQKTAANEAPIYQVIAPPLVYIANAKTQPEFDPAMIILVRRVRVRPTVIFQGRVLDEPGGTAMSTAGASATVSDTAPRPAAAAKPSAKPIPATNPSVVDRVKTFIQKLWTPGS